MQAIKEKIRIGGIKLSDELVLLNLMSPERSTSFASFFFQILKKNQINMPFLSTSYVDRKFRLSCCVLAQDIDCVKALINSEDRLRGQVEFIHATGMLSLFPHQSRLKVLGLSLYAFANSLLPLYGMASSISTLTFITSYSQLDRAVASLEEYMDLPPNHSPFNPDMT